MFKKILAAAVVAGAMVGAAKATAAQPEAPRAAAPADSKVDRLLDDGFDLMKEKDFDGAAKKFKAVLKLDPKHPEALYQMAWISNEMKDYEQAIKYAKATVKVNPKDADAYREMGYAQIHLEQFEDAVVSLEKAIKLNPKDVSAHEYIVLAHKQLGNDDEVADWTKKLSTLKKNTPAKKPTKTVKPDDDEDN